MGIANLESANNRKNRCKFYLIAGRRAAAATFLLGRVPGGGDGRGGIGGDGGGSARGVLHVHTAFDAPLILDRKLYQK